MWESFVMLVQEMMSLASSVVWVIVCLMIASGTSTEEAWVLLKYWLKIVSEELQFAWGMHTSILTLLALYYLWLGLGKNNCTVLNYHKLHWTKKQFVWTALNWKTLQTNWTELFFWKINWTELHCTELHYTIIWTVLHYNMNCTELL